MATKTINLESGSYTNLGDGNAFVIENVGMGIVMLVSDDKEPDGATLGHNLAVGERLDFDAPERLWAISVAAQGGKLIVTPITPRVEPKPPLGRGRSR